MRLTYEDNHIPKLKKYKNVIIVDNENNKVYLYDCNGAFVATEKAV